MSPANFTRTCALFCQITVEKMKWDLSKGPRVTLQVSPSQLAAPICANSPSLSSLCLHLNEEFPVCTELMFYWGCPSAMLHTAKNDGQFLGHFPFTAMSSIRLFFFFFEFWILSKQRLEELCLRDCRQGHGEFSSRDFGSETQLVFYM